MPLRQFIVIGLGKFGTTVVHTLAAEGCEVIAVDNSDERVQGVKDEATQALVLDATEEKTLGTLGVAEVDVVIIGIGSDIQASTLVSLLCKELGAKFIVAQATNRLHGKVLEKIGVDRIVYPEIEMGNRVARSLASKNILEHVELSSNVSIAELKSPEPFWDKTLTELEVRVQYGVNIIAIKRKVKSPEGMDEYMEQFPSGDDVILKDDVLLVFGDNDRLDRLKQL